MKTILLFLVLSLNVFSNEVFIEKTAYEELKEIESLMDRMSTQLYWDRTDQSVQLRGKEIENRLNALIKEVEARKDSQIISSLRHKQLKELAGTYTPPPPRPLTKEEIRKDTVEKVDYHKKWANLPPINREQILQSINSEIPLRWRDRIAAYFISIAAEKDNLDRYKKK